MPHGSSRLGAEVWGASTASELLAMFLRGKQSKTNNDRTRKAQFLQDNAKTVKWIADLR
jgi:hypothetical protein